MYLDKKSKDDALQIYITDALKAITGNTARLIKDGMAMSKRFADLIENPRDAETEKQNNEKKSEEIKARIKSRLKMLGTERRAAGGPSDISGTTHA